MLVTGIKTAIKLGISFVMAFGVSAEEVLVSWEDGIASPTKPSAPGFSAALSLTSAADTYASGSTDGTYGTFGAGASASPTSFRIQNSETFTLSVTNDSVGNIKLKAIRFDFVRRFNASPEVLEVNYVSVLWVQGLCSFFHRPFPAAMWTAAIIPILMYSCRLRLRIRSWRLLNRRFFQWS